MAAAVVESFKQESMYGLSARTKGSGRCKETRGGVLPYNRLMGMCRWMGSHFHDWIDYNGVVFSIELLEWGRRFLDFLG